MKEKSKKKISFKEDYTSKNSQDFNQPSKAEKPRNFTFTKSNMKLNKFNQLIYQIQDKKKIDNDKNSIILPSNNNIRIGSSDQKEEKKDLDPNTFILNRSSKNSVSKIANPYIKKNTSDSQGKKDNVNRTLLKTRQMMESLYKNSLSDSNFNNASYGSNSNLKYPNNALNKTSHYENENRSFHHGNRNSEFYESKVNIITDTDADNNDFFMNLYKQINSNKTKSKLDSRVDTFIHKKKNTSSNDMFKDRKEELNSLIGRLNANKIENHHEIQRMNLFKLPNVNLNDFDSKRNYAEGIKKNLSELNHQKERLKNKRGNFLDDIDSKIQGLKKKKGISDASERKEYDNDNPDEEHEIDIRNDDVEIQEEERKVENES